MSLSSLKFGINFKTPKKTSTPSNNLGNNQITSPEKASSSQNSSFPDLRQLEKGLLKVKIQIKRLLKSDAEERLMEKKLEMLKKKQKQIQEEIFTNLRILQTDSLDITPICSFRLMQKQLKLKENFEEIVSKEYKFSIPSPIQSALIPLIKRNRNIIATSATGSGKTLAYVIPIVSNLVKSSVGSKDEILPYKVLVILPTKELCIQIFNDFLIWGNYYSKGSIYPKLLKASTIQGIKNDFDQFVNHNNIFIATPLHAKQFLELGENGNLEENLKYLVLDEADRMFELGFYDHVTFILHKCSGNSIVKCFLSATMNKDIEDLLTSNIIDIVRVSIGQPRLPCDNVNQEILYCSNKQGKRIQLKRILESFRPPMLIFVDTIESGKELFEYIRYDTLKINYLNSHMSKQAREELIKKFRLGEVWILITTDLLARGIDFKGVKTVLNYDCPHNSVSYIHRVGRTGRGGTSGNSITFVTDDDRPKLVYLKQIFRESRSCKCPDWMKDPN